MKIPIQYLFITLAIGLFSSCAKQFREIRGSENRGNAFLGTGLKTSTATERTDKAKCESISPQQTVIHGEQTAISSFTTITPETFPNPTEPQTANANTNQYQIINGQKYIVVDKSSEARSHSVKKKKLLKSSKIFKTAHKLWGNRHGNNGYLIALGIAGIISSIIGSWMLLFLLISEAMGAVGILLLFIILLFAFVSSIWLMKSPKMEYGNPLKTAAVAVTATSVLLFLLFILGLILGIIV